MPWHVVKSSSGYRVKNKKTGKTYSKKPQSKEKATAQMRAMYANANESRQKSISLSDKLDAIGKKIVENFGSSPPIDWDRARQLCGGNDGLAYVLYGTLRGIARGENPQIAFDIAAENENFHGDRPDIVRARQRVADILGRQFGISVDSISGPDPDFEYDQQREDDWREDEYEPDPDFEFDQRREDEGLMGEDVDDIHDIRAEAFRIAEEAHKTGDESYVKELCRQAASKFRVTVAEIYRMAEAMYNQHFSRGY